MACAYNELYLNDAKKHMAGMFHYALNDCQTNCDWFVKLFIQSGFAEKFERGNPSIVVGMSGVELAKAVFHATYREIHLPAPSFSQERSQEYWAGWTLAEYQWYTSRQFRDIFNDIPLSKMIELYPIYHEMDVTHFINLTDEISEQSHKETKLKQLRKRLGLSQTELAELSGVNLRSVQMYEQFVNDIDKAQARTLFTLSRVLGCSIEDLLENPTSKN